MKRFEFFKAGGWHLITIALVAFALLAGSARAQKRDQVLHNPTSGDPVSERLLIRIVQAEDERRWDNDLRDLFRARNANVRRRAALAAGRIGNEAAVPDLIQLLQSDDEDRVRAMAAFALGEIESPSAADALIESLKTENNNTVLARSFEALGKIAAALPGQQEAKRKELGAAILDEFKAYTSRRGAPESDVILLALTAILRAKPEQAGPVVAQFLRHVNPRVRADAANTLARLKLKDGNEQLRTLLVKDPDPVVRANAARVLGVTGDGASLEQLFDRAKNDEDPRVWVSALRALAGLSDQKGAREIAVKLLGGQGGCARRLVQIKTRRGNLLTHRRDTPDCLDLVTTVGKMFQGTNDETAFFFIQNWSFDFVSNRVPESEIAMARISTTRYLKSVGDDESAAKRHALEALLADWKVASALAQGLGEIAHLSTASNAEKQFAENVLRAMLNYKNSEPHIETFAAVHSEYAIPDVLRALAAFKTSDLDEVLRNHLKESDAIIRATAADLLGELQPSENNTRALVAALPIALADRYLNDAALSIVDALAKQKNASATNAIKTALDSGDYLVRRRAVAALKENGAGDFSNRIGTAQTRNTAADYERAVLRIGKKVRATVKTDKGTFVIELMPEAAPLTVDNFVQLAKRNYFNGLTVHRVVPNFVIQDGDPRGDGNGGPGYQIRCEINELPYDRGAVGMALSGKDTGGSQWFVTHSPQPHLDGGYTVFGNVISGMDVVDYITRGDVIKSITISERALRSRH